MTTFTTNKNLTILASGEQVGTWDSPTNENWNLLDNALGGTATLNVAGLNTITLTTTQASNVFISLTGTASNNVTVNFPQGRGSFYSVFNGITNSSQFHVTLATTAAGGQVIGCPPNEVFDCFTDGTNFKYRSLGHRVGQYWDYASSAVPGWVTAATIPPYLYCNGGTFSSATYPLLATIWGSTTLPDGRGRYRLNINDGTNRVSTGSGGVNGDTLFASGGSDRVVLTQANLPNVAFQVQDPGHSHTAQIVGNLRNTGSNSTSPDGVGTASVTTGSTTTGIVVPSGGTGQFMSLLPATFIGGITLVRAA